MMYFTKRHNTPSDIDEIVPLEEPEISIPIRLFDNLVRATERIEAVKRVYSENGYICTDDMLAILGIEKKQEEE